MVEQTGALAVLFPGQGAQHVGMGKELYDACPDARDVLDQANRILGFDITGLMFEGPEETLTRTANSQPAIFAMSYAAWQALKARTGSLHVSGFAGLSLGEYTALTAAGAVSFAEGLSVVRKRGEYMEAACMARPGTMASVIGLSIDQVRSICSLAQRFGIVDVANANSPGQIVISGENKAVEAAAELAREQGAIRVIELKVSGAFHSRLMADAEASLSTDLDDIDFKTPAVPVVANVTGEEEAEPQEIRRNLARQVTATVLWQASIRFLLSREVRTFVEVGCGKVLQGLVKRTSPDTYRMGVEDVSSLEATAKVLKEEGFTYES
jgi:[acyl-carrier-protein] S-malonyltransferase